VLARRASLADNAAVPEEPAGVPPTAEERQRYLQLVLNAFERELLEPVHYTHLVELLEQAQSVDELKRIVQEMPLRGMASAAGPSAGAGRPAGPAGAAPGMGSAGWGATAGWGGTSGWSGGLDPVDLARLGAAATSRRSRQNLRWQVLVVVVIMFALLLVVGLLLALRVHPAPSGTGARQEPVPLHRVAGTAWLQPPAARASSVGASSSGASSSGAGG